MQKFYLQHIRRHIDLVFHFRRQWQPLTPRDTWTSNTAVNLTTNYNLAIRSEKNFLTKIAQFNEFF